jgi:hypothetical protein
MGNVRREVVPIRRRNRIRHSPDRARLPRRRRLPLRRPPAAASLPASRLRQRSLPVLPRAEAKAGGGWPWARLGPGAGVWLMGHRGPRHVRGTCGRLGGEGWEGGRTGGEGAALARGLPSGQPPRREGTGRGDGGEGLGGRPECVWGGKDSWWEQRGDCPPRRAPSRLPSRGAWAGPPPPCRPPRPLAPAPRAASRPQAARRLRPTHRVDSE